MVDLLGIAAWRTSTGAFELSWVELPEREGYQRITWVQKYVNKTKTEWMNLMNITFTF